MPQYEIKSGRTLYMTTANSPTEAVYKFKQSCGDLSVSSITCVGTVSVLDNVINNFEKKKESYFDYWTFGRG